MKFMKLSSKQIKRIKIGVITLTFVAMLGTAGLSAYFTDTKSATNTFTVGKVSQELVEPSWDKENPPTNIIPGQVFDKDPQVKNTGINDQYVFMTIEVPYANIMTVNDDGTKNSATKTPLFTYEVNDGWTQLENVNDDTDNNTYTYTYYYGKNDVLAVLGKDKTTSAVFSKIKFANIVEGQGLEETTQNVVVNSYGIQTTNLNVSTPAAIWDVINNQKAN